MEISIEIDGIYCPECDALHPVLMWHEHYDDYATRKVRHAEWIKAKKERPGLFRGSEFPDNPNYLGLNEHGDPSSCVVCGTATHFTDARSGMWVCSAECRAAAGHDFARYPRKTED